MDLKALFIFTIIHKVHSESLIGIGCETPIPMPGYISVLSECIEEFGGSDICFLPSQDCNRGKLIYT